MLSYLADYESYFGPLRLFGYLTLRAAFAGLTALLIGFIVGPWIFAKLRLLSAEQSLRSKEEVGALADFACGQGEDPDDGRPDDLRIGGSQCGAVGDSQCLCIHGIDDLSWADGDRFSRRLFESGEA